MKHLLCLLILCCSFQFRAAAQEVLEYELLQTYTIADLEDFVESIQAPGGLDVLSLVNLNYDVNLYKVIYRTPYKTTDNLVQASGAIAVPVGLDCPLPLACYNHGTQAKPANTASHQNGGQYEVALMYASDGYIIAMPDYLGLGFKDESVIIHPYTHTFSQAYTGVNMMRATRTIMDELDIELSGENFIFGYSQGGHATMAVHQLIQNEFSQEFQITASAPMSGSYDLREAQIELMGSDDPYPTPGYLPYIILAYQSMYGDLYEDISEILKSPWDTVVPPLFYSGEYGIGQINGQCPEVPKHIVQDSVVTAFFENEDHPLRLHLLENDLLDWAPEGPVRLMYCEGDDQVSYVNSENAFDWWTANGATQVEKIDFGLGFDHNGCALLCFLSAKNYFDELKESCFVNGMTYYDAPSKLISPNPANSTVFVDYFEGSFELKVYDVLGQLVLNQHNTHFVDVESLPTGNYVYELITTDDSQNKILKGKMVVAR